jgi:hypothetical protein
MDKQNLKPQPVVHPQGAKSSNKPEPRDAKRGESKPNPVK